MKKYHSFLFENFQFFEVKFSIYLNRHVFVMICLLLLLNLGQCHRVRNFNVHVKVMC